MDMISKLARRELVVVMGKGGVGKSAVSAVLGRLLGAGTALLEVGRRESLHRFFATPPTGGELEPAGDGVWLSSQPPRMVLDRFVRESLKSGLLARTVQASSFYEPVVEGCPGLKELAVLEQARHLRSLTRGGAALDRVVLDAPASGHSLSLLLAPRLAAEVVGSGPVARVASRTRDLLDDDRRSALVVVTEPEEMPVSETLELAAGLRETLDRQPDLLVVNRVLPAGPSRQLPTELRRLWSARLRAQDAQLGRLRDGWEGPRIELPLLPREAGPELARDLAARWLEDHGRSS